MGILKKIFNGIFNPMSSLFNIKWTDSVARFFKKHSYLIFVMGFIVMAAVILIVYRTKIFN